MKSLLNYIGKKSNLDIQDYIDKAGIEIDTYCEPFSGGFSAGLTLLEKGFTGKVVLNDLDTEVYNFWICLRDDWEKLYNTICNILKVLDELHIKDEQMQIIYKYKKSLDSFDRASAEYIYRKMLTITGIRNSLKKFNDTEIDFFLQSELLNRRNVEIFNLDYKEILKKFDGEKTFFLIDPPYYVNNVANYYRCDSEFFYHKELRDELINLNAKILITYNDDTYIYDLYKEHNFYLECIYRCFGGIYIELYFNNFKDFSEDDNRKQTLLNRLDSQETIAVAKTQEDILDISELFGE